MLCIMATKPRRHTRKNTSTSNQFTQGRRGASPHPDGLHAYCYHTFSPGVGTVVCESQYRDADRELAQKNYHMTTTLVATLAKRAGIGQLVLFHLSDRYQPDEWRDMLGEAQVIFPKTVLPGHWSFAS